MSDETFDLPPETTGAGAGYDDSDALTPDEFDKLVSGVTHPEGDYVLTVMDVKYETPSADSTPAGLTIKLGVKTPPAGAVSKNGSFDSLNQQFNEFYQPTDGQRKATQIANRDKAAFVKALGLAQPGADGKIHMNAALLGGGKGRLVLAAIVHEKGKDGRTYQRVRNFRPVGG